jgi:hypothetical protein
MLVKDGIAHAECLEEFRCCTGADVFFGIDTDS